MTVAMKAGIPTREYNREYKRQQRLVWAKTKTCPVCGCRPAIAGTIRCGQCAEYHRKYRTRKAAQ